MAHLSSCRVTTVFFTLSTVANASFRRFAPSSRIPTLRPQYRQSGSEFWSTKTLAQNRYASGPVASYWLFSPPRTGVKNPSRCLRHRSSSPPKFRSRAPSALLTYRTDKAVAPPSLRSTSAAILHAARVVPIRYRTASPFGLHGRRLHPASLRRDGPRQGWQSHCLRIRSASSSAGHRRSISCFAGQAIQTGLTALRRSPGSRLNPLQPSRLSRASFFETPMMSPRLLRKYQTPGMCPRRSRHRLRRPGSATRSQHV